MSSKSHHEPSLTGFVESGAKRGKTAKPSREAGYRSFQPLWTWRKDPMWRMWSHLCVPEEKTQTGRLLSILVLRQRHGIRQTASGCPGKLDWMRPGGGISDEVAMDMVKQVLAALPIDQEEMIRSVTDLAVKAIQDGEIGPAGSICQLEKKLHQLTKKRKPPWTPSSLAALQKMRWS